MATGKQPNILNNIVVFVGIVFLLLGVLFGAQIITFIFGNLGLATSTTFTQETDTLTNQSGAFINTTIFTIPEATDINFSGGFVVTEAFNVTNASVPELIPAANYAVDATAGTITNATVVTYPTVNLSYTWQTKTDAQLAVETANNNSLSAVVTYTAQADTQLNTAAIAITLLILIALFLVFWVAFIRPMMQQSGGSSMAGGNFT